MKGSNNKRNKLRGVTEIVNPNHKRKINEDTTWVDLGSGNRPTNSTAQTFGLFYTGTNIAVIDQNTGQDVTGVFGGLGGVEAVSSQVTYGGEGGPVSVDPPTYNQLAVAGFAKPLGKYDNFIRKSAAKKASQINDQLDASEKVAARANADVLMKARVEEAEKIYNDLMNKYEAEKKAVDEYNLNLDNEYDKEKERVRVHNEKIMYQHHKTMAGMTWDSKRKMAVPDIDNVPPGSDLDIQNKLNAKYVTVGEYGNAVMSISPEKWAQLFDEMGGKANEETRKRLEKKYKPDPERPPYKEHPPYPDYPDVYNDSIWNDGLNSSTNEVDEKGQSKELLKAVVDGQVPLESVLSPTQLSGLQKLPLEGMTFLKYLTNQLPPVLNNEYLGKDFVQHAFAVAKPTADGGTSVGDNIIGSGQQLTYNKKTGVVSLKFKYDFKKSVDEYAEKRYQEMNKGVLFALSVIDSLAGLEYGADARTVPGAGWLIQMAKGLGGGKSKSGKITISLDELDEINPTMANDVKLRYNLIGKKLKESKTFKNFMSSINN